MFQEALRSLFGKDQLTARAATGQVAPGAIPPAGTLAQRKPGKKEPPSLRSSRGLDQFFFNLRDMVGLSVLDCGGACEENINFLIDQGHKVYTEDLVRSLDEVFRDPSEQTNPDRVATFLAQNLRYPEAQFDGVLLWDSLQFMNPSLSAAVVDRLASVARPGACMLAFFPSSERATEAPSYTFRIADSKNVSVAERGVRPTGQMFNNRSLERLFGQFESVKFFLTKENLREVIIRR